MIDNTLDTIEKKIHNSEALAPHTKKELLTLFHTLKAEIRVLAETHQADAQSIVHFSQTPTHEATRSDKKPQLVDISLQGLSSSIQGFEKSHPKLAQTVHSLVELLSNIGI